MVVVVPSSAHAALSTYYIALQYRRSMQLLRLGLA